MSASATLHVAPSSSTATLKVSSSPSLLSAEDPVLWEDLASSFRTRTRHAHVRSHSHSVSTLSRVVSGVWKKDIADPVDQSPALGSGIAGACAAAASWWGQQNVPRPWGDPSKKSPSVEVPEDQTHDWKHTRQRVAQAAASVLGAAGAITHEALFVGVDLIHFAPVPGLAIAAHTLLRIWDAVQLVNTNRLQCLRLTERAADSLLSVRQEVHDAGDDVGHELSVPYRRLLDAFTKVRDFLVKQAHRPWIKCYLKRDEILGMIEECGQSLTEALEMFSFSIVVRILKNVQDNEANRRHDEARRQQDTQKLLDTLLDSGMVPRKPEDGLPVSSSHKSLSCEDHVAQPLPSIPAPVAGPTSLPPSEVIPALRTLQHNQNSLDAARDLEDLRTCMRAAMQTGSDVAVVEMMQVPREEMPEAMKTLQRALERVVERHECAAEEGSNKEKEKEKEKEVLLELCKESGEEWGSRDTLDREFIETGIEALRRLSEGLEAMPLPSWTITRYEVFRHEKVGCGFFSDVYRGTWRGRSVAIKLLAGTTPRHLFLREVEIWAGLRHPHVLRLFGASSASGDPPWFMVAPLERNGNLVQYLKQVEVGWGVGNGHVRSGSMGGGVGVGVGLGIGPLPAPAHMMGRTRTASVPTWGSPSASPRMGEAVGGRRRSVGTGVGAGVGAVPREWDLYRFMHEIAKGMEYLHENGVLHGDLKAANVLVDDKLRCVITDFGQSEMRSEAYRISGTQEPHGTLRWQAPELMAGMSDLTAQTDVYAYAITCIEILKMGHLPWHPMDDDIVRHMVLREDTRPVIPLTRFNTPGLQDLLRVCWHRDPAVRPSFEVLVEDVKMLRRSFGSVEEVAAVCSPAPLVWEDEWHMSRPSPDMRPTGVDMASDSDSGTVVLESSSSTEADVSHVSHHEDTVPSSGVQMPKTVLYTSSTDPGAQALDTASHALTAHTIESLDVAGPSSCSSSVLSMTLGSRSGENLAGMTTPVHEGCDSSPPEDEIMAERKNERMYRIMLSHQFHSSLTLPLWNPTLVELGAVGYLSKLTGTFVTLFTAFHPEESSNGSVQGMASLYGYGHVKKGSQRLDERNVAQRGLDAFVGLLTFRGRSGGPISQSVSRRYSFPLRMGHKTAHMCMGTTQYDYMENLDAPKKWFKANVDTILRTFSAEHRIQKEDLLLVIGTLKTSDYALFVTHNHPDGQAHFNVFQSPKNGQPWGTFTTDTQLPRGLAGPSYNEPSCASAISASKVSKSGGPCHTVLIAKLRFKPDVLEPTPW